MAPFFGLILLRVETYMARFVGVRRTRLVTNIIAVTIVLALFITWMILAG